MKNANDKILFWASFLTLIAAGMGFSIRADILADWGRQFGFTQTELGEITGMGLMGFGLTIIFFSFFADVVGYGKLMVIAFLLHAASVVITLAAPFAFETQHGRAGAYWCLYIGQFSFSLANGTCEAVINPLTATLFPKNKTHWLNILHAGWPGGLVLGALVGLLFNQIPGGVGWTVRWGVIFVPMLVYGLMMLGRAFPTSETREHGVSSREMMKQVGILGAAVAVLLVGLWLSKDVFPGFTLPGWMGWIAALALWLGFGWATEFTLGHWVLAFLLVLHAMVGYVELGTDNWIIDIIKIVLANKNLALILFIWANVLMFTLRFFAGPIVHQISPVGLLFVSAVIGTLGLWMLGQGFTVTFWTLFVAVTVYAIGKTFYWPTMLGVISERFPRGGALALGFSGGVGMLSAGILGGPCIGYEQDYAATMQLRQVAPQAYERYKSPEPRAPLPFLPPVAGLDNGKVADLLGEPGRDNGNGQLLAADLEALQKSGRSLNQDENLKQRVAWWDGAKKYASTDEETVGAARLHGGKMALTWTAAVPAAMALGYLLLIFYFKAIGGYKAEVLVGHAAEDEKFTGGTEGPGEG